MFKFTFNIGNSNVNPFVAEAEGRDCVQQANAPQTITRKLPAPPRRPLPPSLTSEDFQRPKKRGWAPTSSSASAPISQPTFTNGWIDTPSRYLEAASQQPHKNSAEDDMDVDLPPSKRRKTLTDSIISTAFSAALIGTAVGMTAYRMWRNRGKPTGEVQPEVMEHPPPPYELEEWVDDLPLLPQHQITPASRTSKLPRKSRPTTRRTPRHRKAPIIITPSQSAICAASPSGFVATQLEEPREDQGDLEDQMDWMGDKIRRLIEEGQKALGKEVVVMSDEQKNEEEGAVDDGMEGWEEDGDQSSTSKFRRPRQRPPQSLTISPPTPSGLVFSGSCGSSPISPGHKRSRAATSGSRSQAISPALSVPSASKLGGRTDGVNDIKVIYESGNFFPDSDFRAESNIEDDDSKRLAERMEHIRKAYRIR